MRILTTHPAPRMLPAVLAAARPGAFAVALAVVFAVATVAAISIPAAPPAAAQQPGRDAQQVPPTAIVAGDSVPALVGYDLGDSVITRPWDEGRLHVVVFWAPYAQPSLNQLPAMQELAERHAGDGLAVVGVTWEPLPLDNLNALRADVGLEFPMLRPHPKFDREWRAVGAFPTTFLVDAEGKVLRRYLGWSEEQKAALAADVAAALAGEALGPVVQPSRDHYVTKSEAFQRRRS